MTLSDFETVLVAFLVPAFLVITYTAGKADFLNLFVEMIRTETQRLKALNDAAEKED